MAQLLDFTDPRAAELALSGGKGANLARMTQAGFPVPPGFVVPAEAYRLFVASAADLLDGVNRFSFDDPERLREECSALRSKLHERPLPPELDRELGAKLPSLLANGAVSVRSSSTLEDLAGSAFAGQHDTYLDVGSLDGVKDAVRRCFASLFEDRAVRYRKERGYEPARASMAVVVQAMVRSEAAGVLFTIHPVTGDLGKMLVNSAWGLGETVVSGEGDVDEFVLDKKTGAVVERRIAGKTHALFSRPGGSVKEELPPERRTAPSLGDAELAGLHALGRDVERHYGFPQDIEWASAGGRLHLLQSRPVTQFPARFTRDESAERFPNVMTPLTWDFVTEGFHESLAHSLSLLHLPPFSGRWFEVFDDYVYGNETAVRLFTSDARFAFGSLDEARQLVPALRREYGWVQELPMSWARDLDGYLLSLGALSAVPLLPMDERALLDHLLAVDAVGRAFFRPNIAISITQGLLHRTLYRLLGLLAPAEAPALHDALTGYCETKTAVVNRDLFHLYELARGNERLAALLTGTDRRSLWESGRLEEFPEFFAAFRKVIADHGHREVDFDAYHPSWGGQPWVVLENVRLLLAKGDVPDPAERELDLRLAQEDAERRFFSLVPEDLRGFALEILRLARVYTGLDDLEHYQTTRLSVPFRKALVELGKRLVKRGVLELPEDVFFLHKKTLLALVAGGVEAGAAAAEARAGKARYLAHRDVPPPWRYGVEDDERPAEGALRGIPGSSGTAEGPVFFVRGFEDFSRFPAGAVLVARTTNPAWTPLFYSAVAVVTESGGPLSHGAVTAREIGLPAVMAVRGVLSKLKEGQRVRVNGRAGTVELID